MYVGLLCERMRQQETHHIKPYMTVVEEMGRMLLEFLPQWPFSKFCVKFWEINCVICVTAIQCMTSKLLQSFVQPHIVNKLSSSFTEGETTIITTEQQLAHERPVFSLKEGTRVPSASFPGQISLNTFKWAS